MLLFLEIFHASVCLCKLSFNVLLNLLLLVELVPVLDIEEAAYENED